MSELQEFLAFEFEGTQRNAQRIRISDIGAVRDAIRMERRRCASGLGPDSLGVLAAQPLMEKELWDYVMGAAGTALLLFQAANRVDKTFTRLMAETMVMTKHEFVLRLFEESHLINPTKPSTSSENSSGSA